MSKKIIVALVAIMLLFSACNKDKQPEDANSPSANKAQGGEINSGDEWWRQYTTKSSGKNQTTSSTATKKSSGQTGSRTTTKKVLRTTTASKEKPEETNKTDYTKVNQYTMTYTNSSGNIIILTKDPDYKYIKKAISMLSSELSETASSEQMMCSTDSSQSQALIYIFNSKDKKDTSTLKYVLMLNSDLTPAAKITSSDGKVYSFFPYAESGDKTYTAYRNDYKAIMNKKEKTLYSTVRNNYTAPFSAENVKTFLSW